MGKQAHRGEVSCPESHSSQLQNNRLEPWPLGLWVIPFPPSMKGFQNSLPKKLFQLKYKPILDNWELVAFPPRKGPSIQGDNYSEPCTKSVHTVLICILCSSWIKETSFLAWNNWVTGKVTPVTLQYFLPVIWFPLILMQILVVPWNIC